MLRAILICLCLSHVECAGGKHLATLASRYFDVWNAHSAHDLRALLADGVTLRDWDVEKAGLTAVVQANAAIWKSAPDINIEVLSLHVSNDTRTVAAEIVVRMKTLADPLRVVDVITYSPEGLIASVRAYKG